MGLLEQRGHPRHVGSGEGGAGGPADPAAHSGGGDVHPRREQVDAVPGVAARGEGVAGGGGGHGQRSWGTGGRDVAGVDGAVTRGRDDEHPEAAQLVGRVVDRRRPGPADEDVGDRRAPDVGRDPVEPRDHPRVRDVGVGVHLVELLRGEACREAVQDGVVDEGRSHAERGQHIAHETAGPQPDDVPARRGLSRRPRSGGPRVRGGREERAEHEHDATGAGRAPYGRRSWW